MQSNKECNGRWHRSLWERVPGFVAALLFFFCLSSSSLFAVSAHEKEYFDIIKGVDLFGEVYREVSTGYVDPLDVSELMNAGIDGMLRTLDPYTVFLDEEDSGELDEMTSGQYVGVGITIGIIDGVYFVTSVVEGYAAAKAGIRVGDSILAINNKEVKKASLVEVKALIKGTVGASLTIRLDRQGTPPFTVSLVREEVRSRSVSYAASIQEVGYIEMKNFSIHSANELRTALLGLLQQAKEQHKPLKGIILDLRNNPGGLLNAAVDVTSLFVRKGSEVVSIRGRAVEMAKSYKTEVSPLDATLPLVVLVNKESASAAEIVSGAIQDLDRGVIIGERSFGKGLVQSVIRLSYDNTLKLTTAKYYTPSGRLIQKESKPAHESRKVLPKAPGNDASQVFYTKNRRKVYGSGGISPDVELSEMVASPYLTELRKKGMLFLFASHYSSSFPVMPPQPLDRHQLMVSFGNFLRDKKFVYSSESERRFNELKESMKKVQPEQNDTAQNSFSSLRQEIDRLKEQEIEKESTGVAKALEVEILRHYNEPLARRAELDNDSEVTKAIEVLSDSGTYSSILHP
ncbi:MAG: S41 family peptidase [Chlorobium sp.]